MLPKEKRLVKSRDFDRVYQKGKRLHSKSFNLSYYSNRTHVTRIGVVAGKKYSKKAVARNKAKRVIRAVVQDEYGMLKEGLDVVIFVKNTGAELGTSSFRREWGEILAKGGLKK